MIWNLANSSSALIDESTKIDTAYFVKSDGWKDVLIDLNAQGALDDVRAAKYDAENWSDLTEEQLDAEIPYFDSYLSANTDINGTNDIQLVSENEDSTSTDSIFIPTGIDLLSINDVTNEYNPRTGVFTRRAEKETVTVSSNAATSLKSGTGNCLLFNSNGIKYDGTISGTTVSVTAADGDYTLVYQLTTPEMEYFFPQELGCFEAGTITVHTDRVTDISFYSDAIYVFDETRPISDLVEVNRVDLVDGRLIPILLENCTVAGDGLSFTIDDAEAGDFYDFTYEIGVGVQDPRISVEMTLPVSIGAQVTSVSESMVGLRTRSNEMSTHLGALGRIVTESGVAERDISAVNIENIIHGGVPQIPTVTIHGTTFVNLLGSYGNFETDTNSDGLADGWTTMPNANLAISLDSGSLFGSKAQRLTSNGNYAYVYIGTSNIFSGISGHIYFISMYGKSNALTNRIFAIRCGGVLTTFTPTATAYARYSHKTTSDITSVQFEFRSTDGNLASDNYALFDGVQLIDLTAAGALDPIRAAKYEASNWSDLTEAQLEAEIPYFDSVLSVNVEDGTASELTIENRGKNLIDFSKMEHMAWASYVKNSVYKLSNPAENNTSIFGAGSAWIPTIKNARKLMKLKPNTPYILSAESCVNIYPSLHNSAGVWLAQYSIYNHNLSNGPLSFTTDSQYIYLDLRVGLRLNDFYIEDVQLEEGSAATDYVPPRTDSITIPDTAELHGYNGVFNTIDSDGNYTKNWERDGTKTTDADGKFALSGYAVGSKVICRNKDNGEVEVLDAAASVTTSWTEADIEIIYQLETPVEEGIVIPNSLTLYTGQNNILFPDSKAPAAFNTHIRGQGSIVWDVITMLNNLEARIVELEEG